MNDPFIQKHFAEFYVQLEGVRLLADKAVQALQAAWELGNDLSAEQRGEVSVAIATAKIAATNTSLYYPEYFPGDGCAGYHGQAQSG